ncbi:MAG TPA: hypothetical protein VE862_00170 [Candidatus Acidoferrum sp.]|nr:hypothetical protein [Candidatus Acidoferrum sp.]
MTTTPPGYASKPQKLMYLNVSLRSRINVDYRTKARIVTQFFRGFMKRNDPPASLKLITTAINAALYAGLGALWVFFPITVFGVRLWPQVFVPAVFAVLFGPWTGGVGAAIGIFIGDVLYGHHDAVLSLLVGVPSNFIGFFVLGSLMRKRQSAWVERILLVVSLVIPIGLAAYGVFIVAGVSSSGFVIGLIGLLVIVTIVGMRVLNRKWANFEVAASIGLGLGSVIIGLGIVGYSSLFALPAVLGLGTKALPTTFIYATTTFTYLSEIPFLILLTPPIVSACRSAFPSLHFSQE